MGEPGSGEKICLPGINFDPYQISKQNVKEAVGHRILQ